MDSSTRDRGAIALVPGTLLAGVAGGIAFPILPAAGRRAGLSIAFIGLILAANRATRIVAAPLVGHLADRLGGRRMLLVGLVTQIAVLALYFLGVTIGHPGAFFLGGRLLQGPGSAGVFIAAQALALHMAGEHARGRASASVRASIAVGVPLGLVGGGLLADAWSDAGAFVVAALAIVLALGCAIAWVPDVRAAPVSATRSTSQWMAIAEGLRDRRLLALGALNFATAFSASGMVLTTLTLIVAERRLVLFGRGERGVASLLMGVMTLAEGLSMPLLGRIGDRYDAHARLAAAGLTVLAVGLAAVGLTTSTAGLVAGLVTIGVGGGALGPSVLAILARVVTPERRGAGVGFLSFAGDIGGTAGPLLGTALFASSARLPYLIAAALLASFVPIAVGLARRTERAPTARH
jgi:MFS family permease